MERSCQFSAQRAPFREKAVCLLTKKCLVCLCRKTSNHPQVLKSACLWGMYRNEMTFSLTNELPLLCWFPSLPSAWNLPSWTSLSLETGKETCIFDSKLVSFPSGPHALPGNTRWDLIHALKQRLRAASSAWKATNSTQTTGLSEEKLCFCSCFIVLCFFSRRASSFPFLSFFYKYIFPPVKLRNNEE